MTTDWTQGAMDQARQLAPWRSNLPWWIALIEGIVLAIVGLLILVNPSQASTNVALFLTIVLFIAGVLQIWSTLRDRVPENVRATVAARGAIAVFAGLNIWLLFFLNVLTADVGRVIFGLSSLIYGLSGFFVAFGTQGAQRRTAIFESIFYTVIGLLMIYIQFVGSTGVTAVTRVVGILALVAGLALIGLAILRQRRNAAAQEKAGEPAEAAQDRPEMMTERVQPADDAPAQDARSLQENPDEGGALPERADNPPPSNA